MRLGLATLVGLVHCKRAHNRPSERSPYEMHRL